MTTIQIDGQTITSSIDRSNMWAKVYGRPVSVIRRELERTISAPERNREYLIQAGEKCGLVYDEEYIAEMIAPYIAAAKKAENELAKLADLDDDYVIWEKAGYNATRDKAEKAKPHNFTLSGTVFRVVKVSDVMVSA